MHKTDKRIDVYIRKSADFAQPVLLHLRNLIHKACPQVEETMKWSFPHFDYNGEMMCSFASFKHHCVLSFWKAALFNDPKKKLGQRKADGGEAMGHFGRITSLNDLPSDKIIVDFIQQAMKLNDQGIKLPGKEKTTKVETQIPEYFKKALAKNKLAHKNFKAFTPGKRKEYIVWLNEAKTEATRTKRLTTAIEWIAENKIRNWKYQK